MMQPEANVTFSESSTTKLCVRMSQSTHIKLANVQDALFKRKQPTIALQNSALSIKGLYCKNWPDKNILIGVKLPNLPKLG